MVMNKTALGKDARAQMVVVTGAARGIGLATSDLFVSKGWYVTMIDRDAEELKKVTGERKGKPIKAIVCDVSEPDSVAQMISAANAWTNSMDALVNNAGVADFGPIEETSFDRWRAVMETNLDGVFLCSQASIPHLKRSNGSIINIASISGLRASTLRTAYGTSKAAVIHLTQQQAAELGEHNIRVNCVAPGPVHTKLAMAVHTPDIVNAYHEAIPLNRYGTETEIAETIFFLASNKASYITGQCISVDGGFATTGVGLSSLRK